MTVTQPRAGASLEELQAALAAARRGEFATGRSIGPRPGAAAPLLRQPVEVPPDQPSPAEWRGRPRAVAVLAAHSGAGASTVAVAAAEALRETTPAVRIVELADPPRSGLAAATDAELGEDGGGWRRGRRGPILIDRLATRVTCVEQVPVPPAGEQGEVVVLDVGWPAREALAAAGWLAAALAGAVVLLLVCRPTVPGIRQAEYLLADLEAHSAAVTVAVLGPHRWPGVVAASAGPRVRAARSSGRLASVPLDRRLEVNGITAEPLPKTVTAAGRALLAAQPVSAIDDSTDQPASGRAG